MARSAVAVTRNVLDQHTVGSFIDYVAFCRAVEEPIYGRKKALLHNSQQQGREKKELHNVRKMRGEAGPRLPQRSEEEEDGYDRNGEGSYKVSEV